MLQITKEIIEWIQDYYKDNPEGMAVIGISGGKDSTICAALLVQALGAHRVIPVLMPKGEQKDISDSERVCEILGLTHSRVVNIQKAYMGIIGEIGECNRDIECNLPARLRMATLYAVAALYPNSRVVNTSNYSERMIGYSTKFGDSAGDFSPLGWLTVREVLEIGDDLGLPYDLVHKVPADGMSGRTDEEKIGFTYDELDDYLIKGVRGPNFDKIQKMIVASQHKRSDMPRFVSEHMEEDDK